MLRRPSHRASLIGLILVQHQMVSDSREPEQKYGAEQ